MQNTLRKVLPVCRQFIQRRLCSSETNDIRYTEKCLNQVMLIGRLGRSPEVRASEVGRLCTFPLATSDLRKRKDGETEKFVEWHRIVAFPQGLVDWIENSLNKGDRILVQGSIAYRFNGGVQSTNIRADKVILLKKARVLKDLADDLEDEDEGEEKVET